MGRSVTLYQPNRIWAMPSASPFCIKLEFFLRANKIPYQLKPFNPQRAPRGKMPFIELGGEFISDSEVIIERLTKEFQLKDDDHLSGDHRYLSHAIRRMLEEGTYFGVLWHRWVKKSNWPTIKRDYFDFMPPVVRSLIPEILRKRVVRTCRGQGISRYEEQEIYDLLTADINAMTHFMCNDGPYFFGEKLSRVDFTVFGFVCSILYGKEPDKMKLQLVDQKKLETYAQAIKGQFFSEIL